MTFNCCSAMKTSSTFLAGALLGFVFSFSVDAKPKAPKPTPDSKLFQKKLSKDEQILHALDRLAFGPRPGDVARVKKIGLKKWIFQQLHPDRMAENPVLEARLQALESLRMTPLEALQHYPAPQMIKAIANGKQPMPDDLLLRASVERVIRRYKIGARDPAELEAVRTLPEVLTPEELAIVRAGTAEQKRQLLESMQPDRVEEMLIAMTQKQRLGLFGPAPSSIRREIFLLNSPQQVVAYDLLDSKMLRAVESTRQLEEELDDFWFNHFNVFYEKGADRFLIPEYERAGDSSARARAVSRSVGSYSQEPGHAFLPGQLRIRAARLGRTRQQAQSETRFERELRPRVDGAAHSRGEWRLHAEGCHRSGALLHRLGNSASHEKAAVSSTTTSCTTRARRSCSVT